MRGLLTDEMQDGLALHRTLSTEMTERNDVRSWSTRVADVRDTVLTSIEAEAMVKETEQPRLGSCRT
jgi:hypothetical protein